MNERTAPESARLGRDPLILAGLTGIWIAVCGNWPLWRALLRLPEMTSARGGLFIAGFAVMIAALTVAMLSPFAWRGAIKPAIAFLLLSSAVGAHFMGAYGIVLDPTMMTNVVQTDLREAGDLLGFQFALSVLLLGGLPLIVVFGLPVRRRPLMGQAWRNAVALIGSLVLIGALVAALFADLSSTMRNHRSIRYLINPVTAYWSLGAVVRQAYALPAGPIQQIGLDARPLPRPAGALPPLLVLVIGETARADHFALNGYGRPTNPELAREDVVSFTDVTSCGTNTAASLPCMLSALGKQGFESRERDQENLLDLVQRAGLAVLWIDNQSGCKGLCDRVPNAMAGEVPPGGASRDASLCDDGECFDETLLLDLDRRIAALPPERRAKGVLVVLHPMGSHGPAYFKRSPPARKPFQPECTSAVLRECAQETIVNAYDNSIAYTDHVLDRTIAWLRGQSDTHRTGLLYMSDHGESLGEANIYLHGLPYAFAPREQKHVAMVAWFGPSAGVPSARAACLRQRRDAPLTHDHLFHTVIGELAISASEYRRELDAFAPCRGS